MSSTSAEPWEYVADQLGEASPPLRTMTDFAAATESLTDFIRRRVQAVITAIPGRPAILLSGGVDSIVIAGVLSEAGLNPLALTVNAEGMHLGDRDRAREVAELLHLEHIDIELTLDHLKTLCRTAIARLGTPELWEIAAAVPMLAAVKEINDRGVHGAILMGSGADALLGGGVSLNFPASTAAAEEQVRLSIWREMKASFTHARLVPDFYSDLLGSTDADRVVLVFQTREAWEITADFSPSVLFVPDPKGGMFDKACLRNAGHELGLPGRLVWTRKSPLQVSSGVFALMELAARDHLMGDPANLTYSDLSTEEPGRLAVRYWLRELADG